MKKNILTRFFLVLCKALLLPMIGILPLQAGHYYFKQLSLSDGLPSSVRCILTDEQGFVWIGTQAGLGRYDGHELKKYIHHNQDSLSIPHNRIHQIIEDAEKNIWILTAKGVARYQRSSDNFQVPRDEKDKRIVAYSACLTPNGILFGSKNKILFYSYQQKRFQVVQTFDFDPKYNFTTMSLWDENTLLCCSRWQGLLLLDLRTGTYQHQPFGCGKEIMNMLIDSQKRLWIAPYNKGVICLNRAGKVLAEYNTGNSSLSHNVVLCLAERDQQIWMGTDGGGINVLDTPTGKMHLLNPISGKENYTLPARSIFTLYNDRNNNMWAGSIRNGLITIRDVSMKTYTEVLPGFNRGLSNATILSLWQESDDKIWIGTDGGGINLFHPQTEQFTHFRSTWEDKIASICPYTDGKLLISVFSKGVFTFHPQTGKKEPFYIVDPSTTQQLCNRGKSVNLFRNTPHSILFLGEDSYCYSLKDKRFSPIEKPDPEKQGGSLMPIGHTPSFTYLYDTKSIYSLDHQHLQLHTLYTCKKDTVINTVSKDENGHFWIGHNYGMTHFLPDSRQTEQIQTSLFHEVMLLVCDQQGKVWIGADGMLFAWQMKERKFVLFGESDGAMQNEYLSKPWLVDSQGDVYMGGVKGLLHINSELPLTAAETPQLQLSDVMVNGEPANEQLCAHENEISIPWNSNITFRIMSKEKDIFRKKAYKYLINGLDNQQMASYEPVLTLRSLSPGDYRIMASCTAKDGSWIPYQHILQLTVLPPWYRTWWFILGCALTMVALIIETFRRTLKREEEKLKWAMKEHEKQVYEEKVRFLINISHELRTPLTLIHAPLSRLLKSLSPDDLQYQPLKAIYRQSKRMKNLINMVLDVRKMEVGESKMRFESLALNTWIETVTQDFIMEGEAQKVQIRYQLDARIDRVTFDKDKCEIILSNLLINALKHSPEQTVITLTSELTANKERVRISIADQGKGLQQVDTQKLFNRFYQGYGEQKGTGIGLSYSKILVELHGGTIGARDNEEVGATFYFELPLRQASEEVACPPKAYLNELIGEDEKYQSAHEETSFDTHSFTLMIVDDNTDLTDFLKKSMGEYFKRIIIASNGVEALQLIRSHTPDLIISDVMMPLMNGYELCKKIKEDITISHIPIILLTARDDKQSQLSGYKNGADGYITKPFDIDMLLELIRNRLRDRESTKKRYLNTGWIPTPKDTTISQADESFLLKLNTVIQNNLDNSKLDIACICKEIGMSRASLYNKLKALTDMGANDYITKFRMEKAMELITTTQLSFTEIAEKVGFTTSRYFSTAFKQYTGETPTQYKEKQAVTPKNKKQNR